MKPREPRYKVMIKARMRVVASWSDVCILNISARGLAMQAVAPPPRGTYLEVRRGGHEITACVIWVHHHRFGVCTQDVLPIEQIIHKPEGNGPASPGAYANGAAFDRRLSKRSTAERLEASRILSRMMEFAVTGVFAASAAVVTFSTVAEALQRPLAEASAVLAAR